MVESGIDIVAFSLAGTDDASNNWRRGVDFDRVCQAVSTLREAREERQASHPEMHFAYLLLASNSGAVTALPPLMRRLGVTSAVISTLDYLPDPALRSESFLFAGARIIEKISTRLGETAAEAARLGLALYYLFPSPGAQGSGCLENIGHSLFISADGAVSPCVFANVPTTLADPNRRVFGNINDSAPLAIWERPEYVLFRDQLTRGEPDKLCQTCRKRFLP